MGTGDQLENTVNWEHKIPMLAVLLVTTLSHLGCIQVSGTVLGTEVGSMKSGIWFETPDVLQGNGWEGEVITIYLYDFSSSCSRMTAYNEDMLEQLEEFALDMEDLEGHYQRLDELQREHLPEEYWVVAMEAMAEDLEGFPGHEFHLNTAEEAVLQVSHQHDYIDFDELLAGEGQGGYGWMNSDTWPAVAGSLTINSLKDGGRVQGEGNATLGGATMYDADAGEITFDFDVAQCESYGLVLGEYYQAISDMS